MTIKQMLFSVLVVGSVLSNPLCAKTNKFTEEEREVFLKEKLTDLRQQLIDAELTGYTNINKQLANFIIDRLEKEIAFNKTINMNLDLNHKQQ